MRLPNKLYTFDESTLANFPRILNHLDNPMRLIDLHFDLVKQVGGTAELIEALTLLLALRKITIDVKNGVIALAD